MKVRIYDSSFRLQWESDNCSHWDIWNRPMPGITDAPCLNIKFDDTNTRYDYFLNHLVFENEPYFLILDSQDNTYRAIVYNPILTNYSINSRFLNDNTEVYRFNYEYYVSQRILEDDESIDFPELLRNLQMNYYLQTDVVRNYDTRNNVEKFKEIINESLKEL